MRRRRTSSAHLQLRHLVERVAEQPLGYAEVAQLLHAAARPHLGGVVGHVAAALLEEPPVAHRVRRLEQRHGARRPDALLQRLRAEQLEARHLVHLRQLPQVERALRSAAPLLAEVELVGAEVADEGGEGGEIGFEHRDLGGRAASRSFMPMPNMVRNWSARTARTLPSGRAGSPHTFPRSATRVEGGTTIGAKVGGGGGADKRRPSGGHSSN